MSNLRTPLYQWHVDHKARMVPFGGWDMPVQYAGIGPEHKAVRTAVGVFDITHMARVSIGGPDAIPFVENLFTNSVAGMKDDQVRYGLVCNEAAGVLDDVLVYRWPYGLSVVVNASNREKILAWMDAHRTGRNVEIRDQTFDTTMVAVQGPKAVELCRGLFDIDAGGLKNYFATPTLYCRNPCVVSRTGYTGEDGLEIIVPNALGVSLWGELVNRGAVPCGLGARDTLRLEAAMPLYGHELTEATDPIHAGLGWAVKLDKGEFIGRVALRAAAADHTRPVRVGLEIDGKRAAREGCPILAGTVPAGTVTSGSLCPWLDKSLAMGYVDPKFAPPGTRLFVDVRGTPLAKHGEEPMSNPSDLRYAPTHEWARLDGDVVTVGVTAFAIEQLTEPTFLELPAVGSTVTAGEKLGIIESYKSTSDLYAPVSGTVIERNEPLVDDPGAKRKGDPKPVNDDPFGAGWMVKIRLAPGATLDHLKTAAQYDEQLASEGH